MNKADAARIVANLPDDPEEAFTMLCQQLEEGAPAKSGGDLLNYCLNLLIAFSSKYGIPVPKKNSPESSSDYFSRIVVDRRRKDEARQIDILIERYDSTKQSFGYAELSAEEKESILKKLGSIRNSISTSALSDRKKKVLLDRIHTLEVEIGTARTPTERFFGFMGDLAFVAGDMAEKAKPAIEQFKDILKIVMRSRADAEGVALPAPEDLPQLPTSDQEGRDHAN